MSNKGIYCAGGSGGGVIATTKRFNSGAAPTLMANTIDPPFAKTSTAGQIITIQGTNLTGVTNLEIGTGGIWTSFTSISSTSTSVTGTAPSKTANVYDIRVTTSGGTYTLSSSFVVDDFIFYLDADIASSLHTGTGISQWDDSLVGGWLGNVAQATGAFQPIDTAGIINGRHALLFNTSQLLQSAILAAKSQPITYFTVGYTIDTAATTRAYYDGVDAAHRIEGQEENAGNFAIGMFAGSLVDHITTAITAPFIMTAIYNSTTSTLRVNRATINSGDAGTQGTQGLTVGATYSGTALWNGYISAMIGANFVPSTTQRDIIENWLEWKWRGSSFSPSSLSGLSIWLDASDAASVHTSAGAVTQWDDLSGNANHFTQPTGSDRPAYNATGGPNGIGSIDFTWNNLGKQWLWSTNTFQPSYVTVFAVAKYDSIANFGNGFMSLVTGTTSGSWNDGWNLGNVSTGATMTFWAKSGTTHPTIFAESLDTWYQFSGRWDGGASTISSWQNAVRQDTTTTAGAITYNSVSPVYIGGYPASANSTPPNGYTLGGSISEILIFNRSLTDSETSQVRAYLSHKWGI